MVSQHRHFNQRSIFELTSVNFTFAVIRTYLQGCERVVIKQQQNIDITLAKTPLKPQFYIFKTFGFADFFVFYSGYSSAYILYAKLSTSHSLCTDLRTRLTFSWMSWMDLFTHLPYWPG